MNVLESILKPVAKQLCAASRSPDRIVFVIHKPQESAIRAWQKLGIKPLAETTVASTTREAALAVWGHDLVTKRWLTNPPADDEIKIFLFAGEGTALLTLHHSDEGIVVHKEPDLHLIH